MATLNSITPASSEVAYGASTPVAVDVTLEPAQDATLTGTIGNRPVTAAVHIDAEQITYSVDSADAGKPDVLVLSVDVGTVTLTGDPANPYLYSAPGWPA